MSETQTLRGLLAPQRALPLGLVFVSVGVVEWIAVARVSAVVVDLVFCVAFVLVVPAAWRSLCAPGATRALGLAVYVAICAALVAALGFALPRALEVRSYVLDPSALGILGVLVAVGGWGLGRDLDLEARATRSEVEAEHAQLLALRAQLDPHFLFNTLNAIAEWCREDPEVAERALLELARILRGVLEGVHESTWPLASELALLRDLFAMYAIRDASRYRLRVELPDPIPDVDLPPMLLLPAFENAITHGPGAGHDGEVVLRVTVNGQLHVEIDNPGAYAGRREGGHGIATVERRLALAYGREGRMQIEAADGRTRTTITAPLEPA